MQHTAVPLVLQQWFRASIPTGIQITHLSESFLARQTQATQINNTIHSIGFLIRLPLTNTAISEPANPDPGIYSKSVGTQRIGMLHRFQILSR